MVSLANIIILKYFIAPYQNVYYQLVYNKLALSIVAI